MTTPHGSLNILMLEEDIESMIGLKEYLEEEFGYTVTLSAEPVVLDALRHTRFDLILLDIMISPNYTWLEKEFQNIQFEGVNWRRTGIEFLKRLRRGEYSLSGQGTPAEVPVILVSAIANDTAATEVDIKQLAEGYIEKPFRLVEIDKLIQRVITAGK